MDPILKIFQDWDTNCDGFISESELTAALSTLDISSNDISDVLLNADLNKDGKIDYHEFLHWVFSKDAPSSITAPMGISRELKEKSDLKAASLEAPPLHIEISNLAGPLCDITAIGSWNVYKLKKAVQAATGIHPANQKLIYNGECLVGDVKLQELLPATGAAITLIRVQDCFIRMTHPHEGVGDDLHVDTLTISEAKEHCNSLDDCAGFTFVSPDVRAGSRFVTRIPGGVLYSRVEEDPEESLQPVEVHFKKRLGFELRNADHQNTQTYLYVAIHEIRQMVIQYVMRCAYNRSAIAHIQNRELIEDLVKANFFCFLYLCQGLRDDPEIVMAAVMQNPQVLEHASRSQQENKELILAAVGQNGLALRFAAASMQADREVVRVALAENPDAYRFACEELRNDKEIVLAVVAKRGMMLRDMRAPMKADREVVLTAIRQNGAALRHASGDLRDDVELKEEARQQRLRSKFK